MRIALFVIIGWTLFDVLIVAAWARISSSRRKFEEQSKMRPWISAAQDSQVRDQRKRKLAA
jgi:hypothetical protein